MTVSAIKGYLQQRGQAPLVDIANHFGAQPETVLGMLEHWQRKGRIRRVRAQKCRGCTECGCAALELFSWIG